MLKVSPENVRGYFCPGILPVIVALVEVSQLPLKNFKKIHDSLLLRS